MKNKITKVAPLEGVIAETAGAFTLYLTEYLKISASGLLAALLYMIILFIVT